MDKQELNNTDWFNLGFIIGFTLAASLLWGIVKYNILF